MNDMIVGNDNNLKEGLSSVVGKTINRINTNLKTFDAQGGNQGLQAQDNAEVETVDLTNETALPSPQEVIDGAATASSKATINLDSLNNMTSETAKDITNNLTQFLLGTGPAASNALDSILNSLTGIGLFNSAEASSISDAFRVDLAATASAGYAGATTLNQELTRGNILGGLAKANETAMNEFARAHNAGQIAHINAYDSAIAGGSDQSVARAQGTTAGASAFTNNFDSTKVLGQYGTAFGNAADTSTNAGFRTAQAMMDSVDMQALKDINIPAADAVFGGAGTNYSNLIALHEQNINNILGTLGFNENGSWNGNVNIARLVPELLMEARDEIQNGLYVPQIAYDSGANMFNRGYDTLINVKNKARGYEDLNPDDVHVYTSIGDSVESGFGLDEYNEKGVMVLQDANISGSSPDLVGKALGAETINQLHMPGARTNELLYILDDGALPDFVNKGIESSLSNGGYDIETLHAKRDHYVESIKSADVITLDIGMNDLWAPVVGAFYTIAEDGIDLTPGQTIVDNYENYGSFWTGANFMTKYISAIATNPDKWGYYVGLVGEGMAKWCTDYLINYPLIMLKIYELNPDATLCVVGGYNPIDDWDLIPGMDDNLLQYVGQAFYDVRDMTKRLWVGLYPGKAVYVDSRGTEIQADSTRFVSPTLNTEGYTPHPTYEGAKHQANSVLGALGLDGLKYQEEDKGIYYNGKDDYEKVVNYHLQEDYVPKPFNTFTAPVQHALEGGVTNFVQGMRRGDADKSLIWSGVEGAGNIASSALSNTSKFLGDVMNNNSSDNSNSFAGFMENAIASGSNLLNGAVSGNAINGVPPTSNNILSELGQSGAGSSGSNIFSNIANAGQNLIGGLTGQTGTGSNPIGSAMQTGQNLISGAMQAGQGLIGGLTGQTGQAGGSNIIGNMMEAGQNLIGGLTGQTGTGSNPIGSAMQTGQNLISGAMQAGQGLIGGLTGQTGEAGGSNIIGNMMEAGQNLIGGLTGQTGTGSNPIGSAMQTGQNLISGAMQAGQGLIGGLTGQTGQAGGSNIIGNMMEAGQNLIGGLTGQTGTGSNPIGSAMQTGQNLISGAMQAGQGLIGGLTGQTGQAGGSNIIGNMMEAGQNLIGGLTGQTGTGSNPIGSAMQTGQNLISGAMQAGQGLIGGLTGQTGEAGGSNIIGNMMEAGQNLIGGLTGQTTNVTNPVGLINNAVKTGATVANDIIQKGAAVARPLAGNSDYLNNAIDSISEGIIKANTGISSGIQNANNSIATGIAEANGNGAGFNPAGAIQGAITAGEGLVNAGMTAMPEVTKGAIQIGAGLLGTRINDNVVPGDVGQVPQDNPTVPGGDVPTGPTDNPTDVPQGDVPTGPSDNPTDVPQGDVPTGPSDNPTDVPQGDVPTGPTDNPTDVPQGDVPTGPTDNPTDVPQGDVPTGPSDNPTDVPQGDVPTGPSPIVDPNKPNVDVTPSDIPSNVEEEPAIPSGVTPTNPTGGQRPLPDPVITGQETGSGNARSVLYHYRNDMEHGAEVYQNVKSGITVTDRYLNGETIAGHNIKTDSPEEVAQMVRDAEKIYEQADSMGIKYDKSVRDKLKDV